ncbi:class I SAM-dependent methyltransferase [Klenkia terrae]|uniref:Class I SAM-dependent methyltransferase n=1 Tax=Klenkia terrae TaxID=1052259 RepID=A0ABU8ECQ7_9ACTN
MPDEPAGRCRSCRDAAVTTVLDLGHQPVADDLADSPDDARGAPRHRLAVGCCRSCGLVQLDALTPVLAHAAHGHGSAFSGTVLDHEAGWAAELMADLPPAGRVLDVGSGSGGLLRPFAAAGHQVLGWERDGALADQATAAGTTTTVRDGNVRGAAVPEFDLVLANHTLSHADDLDAAVEVLAGSLAPGGRLAVEFHSALGILLGGQVDVVCHAHRSYLSLTALTAALGRHGLTVTTARPLTLHGGVVRVQARSTAEGARPEGGVAEVLAAEAEAGLGDPAAWRPLADRTLRLPDALRDALAGLGDGVRVAGYGAPTRGTTLLNLCGLTASELPRTADRSPAKQGRFLPGAGTRVCAPEELAADPPDVVLVLVWPLREEVLAQLADLRARGTRFLFPLPTLELVP